MKDAGKFDLKRKFANFLIGLSDVWTRFEHTLNANISGRKQSIKFSFLVQIMSYLGASGGPTKNF